MKTDEEMRELIDGLMEEIRRDNLAIDSGHELSEMELDGDIADRINNLLRHGPVRVRVMGERSYWRPGMEPGSDIRLRGDQGREGWVRQRCGQNRWAYVEDMTPGDDNNPTRYHPTRSLLILDGFTSELATDEMRVARDG